MSEELKRIDLGALDLAALLCSRVCHDAVGPVGAIVNGLELLDEDDSPETEALALELIRKSARQASARLQFARIAFGAAGSAGSAVDLGYAQQLTSQFMQDEKVALNWNTPRLFVEKNRVKLLMNLVVIALASVPLGGTIDVTMEGDAEAPEFLVLAKGPKPRLGPHVLDLLDGKSESGQVDAHGFQVFYTGEIARAAGMAVSVALDDQAVRIVAKPANV
ncbi:MAG: histidine phosphotransferase family protein [Beijerinckiaceae bacterium]|nr:histidine phosphotransferase family protein [Beijerinckiaceae bacterium]MCZ8300624.1 histidine phosphotransferase family protein [Beijerinckiaceae bacterium]